jgi:hypothetical protein
MDQGATRVSVGVEGMTREDTSRRQRGLEESTPESTVAPADIHKSEGATENSWGNSAECGKENGRHGLGH